MIVALVLIFVVLFIIGAPIAVALGATSLFNAEVFHTISLTAFTKVASNGFNSYTSHLQMIHQRGKESFHRQGIHSCKSDGKNLEVKRKKKSMR